MADIERVSELDPEASLEVEEAIARVKAAEQQVWISHHTHLVRLVFLCVRVSLSLSRAVSTSQ